MTTELTQEEKAVYEWQMRMKGFGEDGQKKLKGASALVSRVGGLGSPLAYSLVAAGIGKLVLAHAGNVKPSDLNRQILMTHDWLGRPRVESAAQRLRDLNPRVVVEAIPENVNENNAAELIGKVDIIFDCAPLFQERFAMNRECVRQNKPLIESAMFSMEGQVTTIIPGKTPCLACIYPEFPSQWKREFPVFGAVAAVAASFAAIEGIKILAGFGSALAGMILYYDTQHMEFRKVKVKRKKDCPVCQNIQG